MIIPGERLPGRGRDRKKVGKNNEVEKKNEFPDEEITQDGL